MIKPQDIVVEFKLASTAGTESSVLGDFAEDVMLAEGDSLGLNTIWFREAFASAKIHTVSGGRLCIVSPVGFIATKCVAFVNCGGGD